MLGYEWTTNHSSNNNSPPHHPQLMLSDVVDNLNNHHHHHHHNHDHDHDHDNYGHNHISSQSSDHHHRPIFDDQFNTHQYAFPNHNHNNDNNYYQTQLSFSDPRAFQGASPSMFTLDGLSSGFSPVIPKTEPDPILNRPIGLNLGGRTYFSPDDDLVSRLYRRSSRPADVAANVPKCQAEGCNADLSSAKHYHRRHKVCEFHSKASTVIANGLIQRFCQQCSRFHMLAEFDNGKRSCRKRLADHNRRRRKSHQVVTQDHRMASPMSSENAPTSPSPRSPKSNSGMNSTSSVTVAMSPPQVSYDSSFRPRLYP